MTDDAFRTGAARLLASRSGPASGAPATNDDPRTAVAREREAALTVEAAALRKAHAGLVARERAISARLDIAEKRRLAGGAAAQRLGGRMRTRVARGVARQLATLPGKVVPAAGTAIAVGSTVLELRDLCDSMQDLAVLNAAVDLPAMDTRGAYGIDITAVEAIAASATHNVKATLLDSARAAAGLAPSPAPVAAHATSGVPVQAPRGGVRAPQHRIALHTS